MALSTFLSTIILVTLIFASNVQALSIARQPPSQVTWIEDLTIETEADSISASSNIDLIFSLHGEDEQIKLQLVPNDEIFSKLSSVHRLRADGSISSTQPVRRSEYYIFKGRTLVRDTPYSDWEDVGVARITVRPLKDDTLFEGTFTIDRERFHVQIDSAFRKTHLSGDYLVRRSAKPYLVAWKEGGELGNINKKRGGDSSSELECAVDGSHTNALRSLASRQSRKSQRASKLGKRQWWDDDWGNNDFDDDLTDTIGSTDGCPTDRQVALLGIATDCTYTADFDSTDDVEANIFTQVNSASQLYEDTFNITLAIRNLSISDTSCPTDSSDSAQWNLACSDDIDTADRLNRFSEWRGQFQDVNALWMLMSGCRTGSTVGISWMGEVCSQGARSFSQSGISRTSSSTNVVVRNGQEWQVIAHEIGHSFGASHDCTSTSCSDGTSDSNGCCPLSSSTCDADGQYIMNPSAGSGIQNFSPCTIGAICSAIGRGTIDTDCLQDDEDVTVISGPSCATQTGENACDVTGGGDLNGGDLTDTTNSGRTGGGSSDWFDENRALVIGLSAGVGSLCLFIIAACICCRVRRKRRAELAMKVQAPLPPPPYQYR